MVKIYASGSDGDQWFYAMELIEGTPLASVCDRLQRSGNSVDQLNLDTWHNAVSTAYSAARQLEVPLSTATAGQSSSRPASIVASPKGNDSDDSPRASPATPGTTTPSSSAEENSVSASSAVLRLRPRISRSIPTATYVAEIVDLVRQTAEAAHALHEAGVIHRDIKPGNIMLWADGRQAVLMDLGLAQLADEDDARLTRTRQFLGTLRYASPEQVLAVARLDRRSDVYSLGATLWELLTLQPLFAATKDTPDPEVMRRIQLDEPERPRKYHPGLSRDLEAVVLRCLEKRPERRYDTAQELADELGRVLSGQPVMARSVGEMERAFRWCKRNPIVSGLLATVAMLLILGTAGMTWKWREAVEQKQLAETNLTHALAAEKKAGDEAGHALKEAERAKANQLRAEKAEQDAAHTVRTADETLRFLVSVFQVPNSNGAKGANLTVQILDAGAIRVSNELSAVPETQAALLDAIGNVYRNLNVFDKAEPLLKQAMEVRKRVLGEKHPAYATSLISLAELYRVMGDYARAEPLYRQALEIRKASPWRKACQLRPKPEQPGHTVPSQGRVFPRRTPISPIAGDFQAKPGRKAPRLCHGTEQPGRPLLLRGRLFQRRATVQAGTGDTQGVIRRLKPGLRREPDQSSRFVPGDGGFCESRSIISSDSKNLRVELWTGRSKRGKISEQLGQPLC